MKDNQKYLLDQMGAEIITKGEKILNLQDLSMKQVRRY
jgi:hypothetical protein